MINIVKIIAENAFMIKGRTEIKFKKGLCLVDGKNGAGKSTIRKMIQLAITGKINGTWENRFSTANHRVSLYLRDEVNNYEIHYFKNWKTCKDAKDEYIKAFQVRPTDAIYLKNGINLSRSADKKATLELFQQDISFNSNIFNYVNLLGGEEPYLPSLTDGVLKKKFDEIIFFFDEINENQSKAKELYYEYNKKYQHYCDLRISNNSKIELSQSNLVELASKVETERLSLIDQKANNEKVKETIKSNIRLVSKDIKDINEKLADIKTLELQKASEKEIELLNLTKDLGKESYGMEIEINGVKRVINKLEKETEQTTCITCGQEISVKDQEKQLKANQKDIKKLEKAKAAVDEKWEAASIKYNELKRVRVEANQLFEQGLKERNKVNDLLNDKTRELNRLENDLENTKSIDGKLLLSLREQAKSMKTQLKSFLAIKKTLDARVVKYDVILKHVNWIKDVLYANKGLKTSILQSLAVDMTNKANEVYRKYFGTDMTIKISTHTQLKSKDPDTKQFKMKEKFSITVVNKQGADSFDGLSQGEKQMVNVCCIEAFAALSRKFGKVSLNFLYSDETFNGLKGLNIDNMVQYLRDKDMTTKLVTSHQDDVKEHFDDVLTVAKHPSTGSKYTYR